MRLVIKRGESLREARDYREFCLRLFVARGSFATKRCMFFLWLWRNGEWRNPDAIEYVDPRSALDSASQPTSAR